MEDYKVNLQDLARMRVVLVVLGIKAVLSEHR